MRASKVVRRCLNSLMCNSAWIHSCATSTAYSSSILCRAHVFERLVHAALFPFGARIAFYQGDPLKLMDDIKALRPTLFVSVPRIYNR